MANISYRLPVIQAPDVTIPIPGGSRGFFSDSDFMYTIPDLFAEPGQTKPPPAGAQAETLAEQIGAGIFNPFADFFTEHQTDYIVGGIGLVLIFAGIFAIVQTVKPV